MTYSEPLPEPLPRELDMPAPGPARAFPLAGVRLPFGEMVRLALKWELAGLIAAVLILLIVGVPVMGIAWLLGSL